MIKVKNNLDRTPFSVGLIVANDWEEADAFHANHPEPNTIWPMEGFPVAEYEDIGGKRVYFTATGPGLIDSACATQELISEFSPDLIVKFGLAGGLTHNDKKEQVYVIDKVIDASYRVPLDGRLRGRHTDEKRIWELDRGLVWMASKVLDAETRTIATTNYFVKECGSEKKLGDGMDKSELSALFPSAGLVDMESAAVARVCMKNNVPCIIIASVTDFYTEGIERYHEQAWSVSSRILIPALETLLRELEIIPRD